MTDESTMVRRIAAAGHDSVSLRPSSPTSPRIPVPSTRQAAAGHPNVPFPTVRRLLSDEDLGVVSAAASSPALPEAGMYAIFDG